MELKVCRIMFSDNAWSGGKTGTRKLHILHVTTFCLDLRKLAFSGVIIGLLRRIEEKAVKACFMIRAYS